MALMCPTMGQARPGLAVFAGWLVGLINRGAAPHSSECQTNLLFTIVLSANIDDGTVRGVKG